jgi:hypothetical protein
MNREWSLLSSLGAGLLCLALPVDGGTPMGVVAN